MYLLWLRLVLGLQERGYVGDQSFHFVNGSSVIWRTLVFQIWRTNLSMVFLCRNLILLSPRFYRMTTWWETRILLTRNLNDCWNVNDSFGNLQRWLLSPWRNWTIRVELLTVSLLMASFRFVLKWSILTWVFNFFTEFFDLAVAVCHAWVVVPFSGEITKEVSREIQECEAKQKTLVV